MSSTSALPRFLLLQQCTSPSGMPLEAANFARAAGLAPEQLVSFDTLSAPPPLSLLSGLAGVFIGGSAWSVFEDVPNLAATKLLLAEARGRGIPLMGVCFGSQLIAATFGGTVIRDEANEEFGTIAIEVAAPAAADPWLGSLPRSFAAQSSHRDRIATLPPGARVLASSDRCPVQAFAFSAERIYGVQFHPERRLRDVGELFALPGYAGAVEKIAAGRFPLAESPEAGRALSSFVELATQEKEADGNSISLGVPDREVAA